MQLFAKFKKIMWSGFRAILNFRKFKVALKGGNSLPKHFERNPKIHLYEFLNFLAFMKPNKHKKKSKGFSTTWPNLFLNTFVTVGEF